MSLGCPLPPYIKEWRRGPAKEGGAPKGGSPTPTGSRTPLGRAIERAGPPLLHSFIYGGRGHPIDTTIDLLISLPCAVPPSTILLDNIVAVLRQSPATIEHQDRHHAIVLTELFPDTLWDRSPGIVIELNVC